MVVSVDLPDAVLRILGLSEDSSGSVVKERLENLDKSSCLEMDTRAGVVRVGFQNVDSEETVAFAGVQPQDSRWLSLFEASVADSADGDIGLEMFANPSSVEHTHLEVIRRSDIELAKKASRDYAGALAV